MPVPSNTGRKHLKRSSLFAATSIALAIAAPAQAASYTVTPYDTPGSTITQLWGINDHGVFVGNDDNGGFVNDHGNVSIVNPPGSTGFGLTGISNSGLAVGTDTVNSYFYQAGVFTPFAVAGADTTLIRAISSNGRYITGTFTDAAGDSDGFVFDNATSALSTILGPGGLNVSVMQGVNDSGVATGSLSGGPGSFIFDSVHDTTVTVTDGGGLTNLRLRAIDNAGDLAGWASDASFNIVGFIDTVAGGYTTFDLSANGTLMYGLDNLGDAVGWTEDADGGLHGFTVMPTSAVPEPSSAALLLIGLLAAGTRLGRRRGA